MSLTARRFLYSTFIAAFFIITTLVISYANGYSISWTSGRLIKTGTFVFKTEPADARIYLNGQLQTESLRFGKKRDIVTPTKIKNLLPGDYSVRFELAGYHPWEKKLTINSGESTYAETVKLFSQSKPLAIEAGGAKNLRYNPVKNILSWQSENKVNIFDIRNNKQKLEIVGRPINYTLQENAEHVLVDGNVYPDDVAVPIFSVEKLIGVGVKNIQFVQRQDKIAFSFQGKIEAIDLTSQKISTLYTSSSSEVIDFNAHDNRLEILSASSSRYFWDFYRNGESVRSLELPVGRYRFEAINSEWLALYDTDRELVYLVQANSDDAPIKTVKQCKKIAHIRSGDFLCTNEYEIFTYNSDNLSSTLLDRLSEPVMAAYWHKTNNYVVYLTKSAVYSLELDQRDFRNKTKIMDIMVDDSVYDQDTGHLYISGQYEDQKGIFISQL